MCELVAARRHAWKNTLSAEDCAKLEVEKAMWSTPEGKAERMQEFNVTFASSDTNSNGLLTADEFHDFMNKLGQNAQAKGIPYPNPGQYSPEEKQTIYAWMNSLTAGTEGVSSADFFTAGTWIQFQMREISEQ